MPLFYPCHPRDPRFSAFLDLRLVPENDRDQNRSVRQKEPLLARRAKGTNRREEGRQIDTQPYNHTLSHIVKTTLVLPDDLLMEAKIIAARRKTTLKAIIESALRRELRPASDLENPDPARFEVGPFGILRIRKVPGRPSTTLAQVRAVQKELDEEELRRAIHPERP